MVRVCEIAMLLVAAATRQKFDEEWRGPELNSTEMQWIEDFDASKLFCKLLEKHSKEQTFNIFKWFSPRKCEEDCDRCCAERASEIFEEVKEEVNDLKSFERPFATFVLGAVASGKSSFIRKVLKMDPNSLLHVNADDLRSRFIGGYSIYSAMMTNNRLDGRLWAAANELRNRIQALVLKKKVNFLADSLTLPAFVVKKFLENNFQVKIYYVEVAGEDFDEKAKRSSESVEKRVDSGGPKSAFPFLLCSSTSFLCLPFI